MVSTTLLTRLGGSRPSLLVFLSLVLLSWTQNVLAMWSLETPKNFRLVESPNVVWGFVCSQVITTPPSPQDHIVKICPNAFKPEHCGMQVTMRLTRFAQPGGLNVSAVVVGAAAQSGDFEVTSTVAQELHRPQRIWADPPYPLGPTAPFP